MEDNIKALSQAVVDKIFAGEVIERPASAVKELVENSIDAGADFISVKIDQGGRKLILVSDNGIGMSKNDLFICTERYTTSKISSIDDIYNIKTLGFRGEALSSLAAVSKLEIISLREGSGSAFKLESRRGKRELTETAGVKGTTVSVRDMFMNVPARLKFMKTVETESAHIYDFMVRVSLANPDIEFKLDSDGREALSLTKASNLRERIYGLYGAGFVDNLVKLEYSSANLKLSGYIGKPDFNKSQKNWQYIYVNGRVVTERTVAHGLSSGYDTLLPAGRYPVCVLFIETDPSTVDVNVHPSKKEIKFVNGSVVHNAVVTAVKKALETSKPVPVFTSAGMTGSSSDPLPFTGKQAPAHRDIDYGIKKEKSAEVREINIAGTEEVKLRLIKQVRNRYILAEEDSNLVIIDQHVAHEKVIYSKLLRTFDKKTETQGLLLPVSLELSPIKFEFINKHLNDLVSIGFDIEIFGKNTLLVRGVPVIISRVNPEKLLLEIAEDLEEYSSIKSVKNLKEEVLKSIACHSAFRSGDNLTNDELVTLLRDFLACDLPYCPHGRPGIIRISFDEIDKKFKRT